MLPDLDGAAREKEEQRSPSLKSLYPELEARIRPRRITDSLRRMVKIPSVNPLWGGDGETLLAEHLAQELLEVGLKIQRQGIFGVNRFNILGEIQGDPGPSLLLCSHMDTVAPGDMTDPFEARISNDLLYGRGACDAKASLAGMLEAVRIASEERSRLKGRLIFAGLCDEEYQSLGALKLAENLKCDYIVNGEPTRLRAAIGHRGFVWLKITSHGVRAHGSVAHRGVDAIGNLVNILHDLLKRGPGAHDDPLLGRPSLHMGTIEGGIEPSVVPHYASSIIEYRTVPPMTGATIQQTVKTVIQELKAQQPSLDADVSIELERPAFKIDASDPFIEKVTHSLSRAQLEGVTTLPYWTDIALLGRHPGVKGVVFGPGDIGNAHSSEEQVSISEVVASARGYLSLITEFLG